MATYFTLAAPRSFRCSVDFLRRVLGPQPWWKWPWLVWRHFFSFGITLLDRVAVILGRGRIECRFEGESLFRDYLDHGQGVILLGAHVGSWEIGGHLLGQRLNKPVNVVILEREEQRLRQLFAEALAQRQFRLLTTDESPLRSVPILGALRRAEIVALAGGSLLWWRGPVTFPFLEGRCVSRSVPIAWAAASGAPLFQVFVVRERLGLYRFVSYPPQFVPRELLRAPAESLRPYVALFVDRLSTLARDYPFQWFNIYPLLGIS